jgi:hypothetical protein
VQVTAEEELERLLPKRVAVVEVTLADGTHLSERNDTVRGTPEHPISKDEIVAKAIDLITPVLGAETCTSLIEKVFGLEQMKDVREPRPLLQRTRSGKAVEPWLVGSHLSARHLFASDGRALAHATHLPSGVSLTVEPIENDIG